MRVTGVDPRLPERVDGRAVAARASRRAGRGQRVLAIRRADRQVLPLDQPGVRVARLEAERGEQGAVEPLGRAEVGHGNPHMVEHRLEATTTAAESPQGAVTTPLRQVPPTRGRDDSPQRWQGR